MAGRLYKVDNTSIADDLQLFTVINGIQHYGELKLEGKSAIGNILGSVIKNKPSTDIGELIKLIPIKPTLDGHTSILNAVNEITSRINGITPADNITKYDDKKYNEFKEFVNYIKDIILKVNIIKQNIERTSNDHNKNEYINKYKLGFTKLYELCGKINGFNDLLKVNSAAVTVSNLAVKSNIPNETFTSNLELINSYVSQKSLTGGAKTRRKRLRRRASTYKRPR